ncbi:nitroreductase family deazaflavin-dependent oxidoreductase [Nocardia sp. NBC_00416]|uniref:nitroreductase family deazaflavin-dependent oxidoreductase n=1 Tax=Nocardia sp. NBC_00416 TaxID=2975991 RepID=UPI002E1D6821
MSSLSRLTGLSRRLNPLLAPLARTLPPLAVLHHQGRRSGRRYDTPVQAYRTDTGFVVALAYTTEADWAHNLLAAGSGEITRARQRYTITDPHRRGREADRHLPAFIAWMFRALGIDEFVEFDARPAGRH